MTIHNDQMPPEVHTKCWPVNQVDRLPAKLSSAVCHSQHKTTIVPKLTRYCKANLDKFLLEYKTSNNDICYIIRNAENNLKILIKRFSKNNHVPHREINLEDLGKSSTLKEDEFRELNFQ